MTFTRYAIYYAPPAVEDWAQFATAWLGWNMDAGQTLPHPPVAGLDVAAITDVPRKYGLHATMKPPFRLAGGQTVADLEAACADLAARQSPVTLDGLSVAKLGRFLALRSVGDEARLNALAAACVRDLDSFRAPATEPELARRRAAGLTPEQDTNLTKWGYPFVMDAFRFHITLTGKLDKATLGTVQGTLDARLTPLLPQPLTIRDLALVGEAEDGRFHLIHRYVLSN